MSEEKNKANVTPSRTPDNEQVLKHSYVPPTTSYPPMPKITPCETPTGEKK